MEPLTLTQAMDEASATNETLAAAINRSLGTKLDAATVWRWRQTENTAYTGTAPSAAQFDIICSHCRLSMRKRRRLSAWFRQRAQSHEREKALARARGEL